jgi:hypothetical protein
MNSAAVLQAIFSPALRQITSHWYEVGHGGLPSWCDIKPAAIAPHLPIIWAFRFDRQTGKFTGRLAGAQITEIFGKSFRGLPLEEAHPVEIFPWVHTVCRRIVTEPAIYHGEGLISRQGGKYGRGERILLPLSEDGRLGDGILGASEYETSSLNLDIPIEPVIGNDRWFPIEQAELVKRAGP